MVPIVVFASGGGSNLEAFFEAEAAGRLGGRVVAVVSDKPEAFALERARQRDVPAIAISPKECSSREAHERAILDAIAPYAPRLAVLAGYMRLVTPTLLGHFYAHDRLGVVNIHPADTRAYQGTKGYHFALGLLKKHKTRQKQTKITVHYVDVGMDTGPIIAQGDVEVRDEDTLETLKARGLEVEHALFPRVVDEVCRGVVRLEGRQVIRTD